MTRFTFTAILAVLFAVADDAPAPVLRRLVQLARDEAQNSPKSRVQEETPRAFNG